MSNIKFPRISHFPFSPQAISGNARDDKIATTWERYLEKFGFVVMEKMDGSNVCLTRNNVEPRGSGMLAQNSFDWLKSKHAEIKHKIPVNYHIYGENMYAIHSIKYDTLTSPFYIFGIYDSEYRHWLSPLNANTWAKTLGFTDSIISVGGLWEHKKNIETDFKRMYDVTTDNRDIEGYVVWANTQIPSHLFNKMVFKWVRPNHIQTDNHWSINWKKQWTRPYPDPDQTDSN